MRKLIILHILHLLCINCSRRESPSAFFLGHETIPSHPTLLRPLELQFKLGRPGISEGPEKDREGGPDEISAVRIPPAAIARKYVECV